ncbi:PAS domain S-box protein [Mariprofundus ferrooxydans]|uniref:PAS domain S-box protein n=1 Tax=Mariprofundus ferrooxydans TaxID=314344 RepID=UPI00143048CD|nr:PAS domain S-box protein [Mariprofundus ferrooxydans]
MDKTNEPLRILMLEDLPSDAEKAENMLRNAGMACTTLRVDNRKNFEQALDAFKPDVVLTDYNLATYSGREALKYVRSTQPQTPVIIVTGAVGDETAVELLKLGARDYVLKSGLVRLAPAIEHALSEEKAIRSRKQTEQIIRDEQHFSDMLIRSMPGVFFLLDQQGSLIRWNRNLMELSGRTAEEMASASALDFTHEEDKPLIVSKIREALETGHASVEARLLLKEGVRLYDFNGFRIETPHGPSIIGIGTDITERKQTEKELLKEKRQAQQYFDIAEVMMVVLDTKGHITLINKKGCQVLGYDEQELVGRNWFELCIREDMRQEVQDVFHQLMAGNIKVVEYHENEVLTKGGTERTIAFHNALVSDEGVPAGIIFSGEDITERKQSEKSLKASRDLLQSVVETAPIRIFWKDKELRYLGCNNRFAQDAGFSSPDELTGKTDFDMGWQDQAELYRSADSAVMESGKPQLSFEEPQTTPDGNTIWLRTSKVPLRNADDEVIGMLGLYEDITDEKRAQDSLRRLNRALLSLSACNRALVHAESEEQLWQQVCRAIVEQGQYLLAWVGYMQQDEVRSVKPMASYAVKPGYVESIQVSWADVPEGRGPIGTALRSGKAQYAQNIAHDATMHPWCKKALAYGYQASIALPLFDRGQVFGVLTIYAAEADAFNVDEIALLEEIAGDLGFGINAQRTQVAHEQHTRLLHESLEQSIQAIADTVAARDPYTSGHQRRVAELATAIAGEMGLTKDQTQGIHLAASIHDLGKIRIPAEILAKPGKLSELEYQFIKQHPQSGYDILKDVIFPWPIADIILQHHEKLDGSGYPHGLKGDAILLEARILCVADVVEAISSHRPFRPSLGLEAALTEINDKRGTLFDPAVVDACTRLFREHGYKMPN